MNDTPKVDCIHADSFHVSSDSSCSLIDWGLKTLLASSLTLTLSLTLALSTK